MRSRPPPCCGVGAATQHASPDIRAQVRATADAALDYLTADPRRGQLLLSSYASGVLQRDRLSSARAVSNTLSAMIRESLGPAAASELDTDLTSFALVSGVMELIAGWLRDDFDTSREHFADLLAGLLPAAADVSTALSKTSGQPAH